MKSITTTQLAAVLWWAEGNTLEALEKILQEEEFRDALLFIELQFNEARVTPDTRARWLALAKRLRA